MQISAAAALVVVASLGLSIPTGLADSVRQETESTLARARRAPSPNITQPPTAVIAPDAGQAAFSIGLEGDVERFGLRSVGVDELAAPLTHRELLRSPRKLRPGKKLKLGPLRVRSRIQKLPLRGGRGRVGVKHTVLELHNTGNSPLAYRLETSVRASGKRRKSKRGRRGRARRNSGPRCDRRGLSLHDTLTLMPGERARISICDQQRTIGLERLQVVRLPAISARYLQQLPPQLFGDELHVASHNPRRGAHLCSGVPAARIRDDLAAQRTRWSDVIDFYARHNCHRWQMPTTYRKPSRGAAKLPDPDCVPAAR